MEEPTPALACFPELVRMRVCNRTAPRSLSTSLQIRAVEVSAGRVRDRLRARTAHLHHRERSSDCPPNAQWPATGWPGDCEARFSKRARPARVRSLHEKSL